MDELLKPFLKNSDHKTKNNTEIQCKNAASENKKPLARNVNLTKNRPRMKNEWIGKTILKYQSKK